MCSGRPTPREEPRYELPTLERLSKLDLGVHPILSFPDGQCCTRLFMQPFPVSHPKGKTNKVGPRAASVQELAEALHYQCSLSPGLFRLGPKNTVQSGRICFFRVVETMDGSEPTSCRGGALLTSSLLVPQMCASASACSR